MFTPEFQKVPLTDRPACVEQERQRRVEADPEAYVAVPVLVPKMSTMVEGAVADYELFWLVGLPGPVDHPRFPGKKAREAINFQCSREETAEDLVYVLNNGRLMREISDNARKSMAEELDGKTTTQTETERTPEDVLTSG